MRFVGRAAHLIAGVKTAKTAATGKAAHAVLKTGSAAARVTISVLTLSQLFPPWVSVAVRPDMGIVLIAVLPDLLLFCLPFQKLQLFALGRTGWVPVGTALAWVVAVT